MKQIYTLFAVFLFITGAAFAQGTAADTTFYTDEQGRTVILIKQKQGTPAATAQQQNDVQAARFQTVQDASQTGDSVLIYQNLIDTYSKSAHSFRTKGNVLLWSGIGVAVIGVGLMIAGIASTDVDDDDCSEYDDGSYYCSNNDVSPEFVVGYAMVLGGAAMTTTGIIFKIVGGSKNKKADRKS